MSSIDRALRVTDPDLEIEVRAVHFPDEPVEPHPWLLSLPTLERSVLDLAEFEVERRLPLMTDVLGAFGDPGEYDLAVLTNADIAVQPFFYELVRDLAERGHDAFSITRRTVQPRFGETSLAHYASSVGSVHPGHDCFVMRPSVVPAFVGDVALGVRWVGRCVLWSLMVNARRYQTFYDLHATFHIGDDKTWTNPRFADYDHHNAQAALEVVRRLVADHGAAAVARLPGAGPLLSALRTGGPFVPSPSTARPRRYREVPSQVSSHRLIFSANSGRAGSEFLAELLDSAPAVSAGHERQPCMTGPWLREVWFEGPSRSVDRRRVKADAIRAELRELPVSIAYADTTHMFVKTFADVVFDEFEHHMISVVILRRNVLDVAHSFFALDYFGIANEPWLDWMPSPTAPYSPFRLDSDAISDQFDLIFGYLVGLEARTEELRALTPAVCWVETSLAELTTVDGATRLFNDLDLRPPSDLATAVNRRVNERLRRKEELDQYVSLEFVADRWTNFVGRFGDRPEVAAFAAYQQAGMS